MTPVTKTNQYEERKNTTPWILVPSKSIPEKFYYFNVKTAEAVWCLSDADKFKKDTIHKITDAAHSYPEPVGLPNDESTNTTNSFSSLKNATPELLTNAPKDINPGPLPAPMFGQAVFPKYVTDVSTPNIIWAFTPLYLPDQQIQQPIHLHKDMMDQIIQTYESNPILVQNSSFPNSFQNVKKFTPKFQFNQTYQNLKQPIFGQTPECHNLKTQTVFGQTPTYNPFKTAKPQTFGIKQREPTETFVPIRRRVRNQPESDSPPKSVLKKSQSVGKLTSLFTDVETSTSSPDDNKDDKLSELSKNDLRFLLVAKKKKVLSDEVPKSTDKSKSITQKPLTLKKRVTFDLQQPSDISSEDSPEIDPSVNYSQIENPSIPERPLWYVATDTSALLSQLQTIEQFVKKDPNCRLLIPYTVYKDVEALSRRDCGVVPARLLLRRLGTTVPHIIVQSKPDYEHASYEDNILQCCWDLMQGYCRVVLITDNKTMTTKAKSIQLECHTLEEIMTMKEDHEPTSTSTELIKEITDLKIIVSNEKKKSENLFLQDLSEINNFPFSKINGYSIKGHQAKQTNQINTESKDSNVFGQKDTNSDKLINLTKPKTFNSCDISNVKLTKPKNLISCDISNVNDKILKLSIKDNSAAKNRTKQILQNVFRNTEVNKTNQDQVGVVDQKNNSDKNPSETKKTNCINQDHYKMSNEINEDIRKLNLTGKNPVKEAKDNIKVSGITKLNSHFNLVEELERFRVKNGIMENRIKSRLDEWLCRLNQTMEVALTDVLIKENVKVKKMTPPWTLFEAIQVTGEAFKKQQDVKKIVDSFSMKHFDCTANNGKLIKNMKPNDFMKLVGFSLILVQHLKEIVDYIELSDAEDMLIYLIKNIEDPNTDIDLPLGNANTPFLSRSEIPEPVTEPLIFVKKDTEIIEYLKKHFKAWETYEINSPKATNADKVETAPANKEPNILRTFGKNLNMLKISNTKTITMETEKVNIEPKVIRNVKIIEAFEEKLKQKQELDMNKLDYENEYRTLSSDEDGKIGAIEIDEATDEKSIDFTENDIDDFDSVNSELETECVRAYPLAKVFLVNLKRTFIRMYSFINDSMKEYKKGMTLERKQEVKIMTEMAHGYVRKISERLNRIIARESGDGTTLKDLLIKAGDYVEDDNIISNYKNVVATYLEQAQVLEEALTLLLSLSNAVKKREGYTGTFTTSSPILPTRVLRSNQMLMKKEV